MSLDHAFVFRFRWVFWALGAALILALVPKLRPRALPDWEARVERRFLAWTGGMAAIYFLIASLAKFSQLRALVLNSQDFWLFEDMLRQMGQGAPFVTRFAPQALGFLQHGVIHPTFILFFALPLAAMIGTTGAALLFGPLCLAAAGAMVSVLARPRWGAVAAWCLGASFFALSQVGKILMYDMHPEAAYPLLAILAGWMITRSEDPVRRRKRVGLTALIFLVGMSIKEDALLVFGPIAVWSGARSRFKHLSWVPLVAVLFGLAFQFHAIGQWKSHHWGPEEWMGLPLFVPQGADFLQGVAWDSPTGVLHAIQGVISSQGGIEGAGLRVLQFLLSRPFLSLILWVPWVVRFPGFWFCLAPVALAHAVLGGLRASLIAYYSAPFLGILVYWALLQERVVPSRKKAIWALGFALLVGSGAPEVWFRSPLAGEVAQEVARLKPCLGSESGAALFQQGIVTPALLGEVPREGVLTDRVPPEGSPFWGHVDHVLFTPDWPRWETSAQDLERLRQRLLRGSEWIRMEASGSSCVEILKNRPGKVQLFVRKPR